MWIQDSNASQLGRYGTHFGKWHQYIPMASWTRNSRLPWHLFKEIRMPTFIECLLYASHSSHLIPNRPYEVGIINLYRWRSRFTGLNTTPSCGTSRKVVRAESKLENSFDCSPHCLFFSCPTSPSSAHIFNSSWNPISFTYKMTLGSVFHHFHY